jgi:hypothetical protein
MGCDIHLYKEKFVDGKWLTADEWVGYDYGDDDKGQEVPYEKRYTGRNYNLFGILAKGVRRDFDFAFEPRGFPFNSCAEIAAESDGYGSDGHSHSYLYLHELKDMQSFLAAHTIPISGMKDAEELAALQATIDAGAPNWDLLYPYCQGTTDTRAVHFKIQVPASFITGSCLDQIISSFDGIDGENHRIIFFFDN